MRAVRTAIIAAIFWYLLGAFVGATWDITEWAPEGRMILVILWLASLWRVPVHTHTNDTRRDGTGS